MLPELRAGSAHAQYVASYMPSMKKPYKSIAYKCHPLKCYLKHALIWCNVTLGNTFGVTLLLPVTLG